MAEVTQLPLNPPPKAGEAPSRNALRQRRHRAKKRKASVTRNGRSVMVATTAAAADATMWLRTATGQTRQEAALRERPIAML